MLVAFKVSELYNLGAGGRTCTDTGISPLRS